MTPKSEAAREPASDIAVLTAQMAKGDDSAYRQFYDRYFGRLLRYLLVVTGGKEDAAREALQATMLRAARHMRRFDSEAVFWSWLTVLARSAMIDEQRKESRYQRLLRRFFQRDEPSPTNVIDNTEAQLLAVLERSLSVLPSDERDLVERKYFAKQPVRDIAAQLGTTEKAVESRLVRVRRRLKDVIMKELNHA